MCLSPPEGHCVSSMLVALFGGGHFCIVVSFYLSIYIFFTLFICPAFPFLGHRMIKSEIRMGSYILSYFNCL